MVLPVIKLVATDRLTRRSAGSVPSYLGPGDWQSEDHGKFREECWKTCLTLTKACAEVG